MKEQNGNLPRFLAYWPVTVLPILLPYFGLVGLHLSPTALSLLVAAYPAAAVAARLLLVPLADGLGPRRVFLLGLALFVGSDLAFALFPSAAGLFLGRILLAAAVAGVSVASLSRVAEQPTGTGQSLGGLNRAAGLGGLLGVLLCFAAMQNKSLLQGWRQYFLLCALAGAAGLLAAFVGWRPPALPQPDRARRRMTARQKRWSLFSGCACLCSGLLAAPLVLYLNQRFHAGLPAVAAAFLAPLLLCALLQPALGRLRDRQGHRALRAALLLGGLSIALAPLAPSVPLFAAAYMLFQLSAAQVQLGADAAFLYGLPAEQQGGLTARYTACAHLGGALGSALGGILFQYGGASLPFGACAAGFVLLFFLRRPVKA